MNFPRHFVMILHDWNSKLTIQVKWLGHLSATLAVRSGARQEGILSPLLFNSYVNCMLIALRSNGFGCFLKNTYFGAVTYAVDLLLRSASLGDLQKMLNLCGVIDSEIGLSFNSSKLHCMMVGPNNLPIPCL